MLSNACPITAHDLFWLGVPTKHGRVRVDAVPDLAANAIRVIARRHERKHSHRSERALARAEIRATAKRRANEEHREAAAAHVEPGSWVCEACGDVLNDATMHGLCAGCSMAGAHYEYEDNDRDECWPGFGCELLDDSGCYRDRGWDAPDPDWEDDYDEDYYP